MAIPENVVIPENANAIERFAADELIRYIKMMTDRKLNLKSRHSDNAIYIGCLPESANALGDILLSEMSSLHKDGFVIRDIKGTPIIYGKTPRASMYGVYTYLQMLGARWYFPGAEFIPKKDDIYLKGVNIKESPDIDHRSIVIHFWETSFNDWIDFAAKTRLNAIHLHSDDGISQMPHLIESRGLEYNVRRHFFGDEYSLSDNNSIERDKALLVDYISKLPYEIGEFFLWPADVRLKLLNDSRELPLPDAILMFTNEVSKAINTARTSGRLSFLDYWSTWGVPENTKPLESVFLEIAPIQRCFSHSLDDPECPVNAKEIAPVIDGLVDVFPASESHVLEYWLDASLFGRGKYNGLSGRMPQIGQIIKQDIRYYKSRGLNKISTFAVGLNRDYLSKYSSPGIFQYPALLWDNDYNLESELLNFCQNFYGDRSIADAFSLMEKLDPGDTKADEWEALRNRLSRSEMIIKEIEKATTNDDHAERLGKLSEEINHVRTWINSLV